MEKKTELYKAIDLVRQRKVRDFNELVDSVIEARIVDRVSARKDEVAKTILTKEEESIDEAYEGKNIIDGLARIADMEGKGYPAMSHQTVTLDNGDEVDVDPESARKLVNFFRLYDEKEQFGLQRKMRASKNDFLEVAAAAAAKMGTIDYSDM